VDVGLWVALGSSAAVVGALVRPITNMVIAYLALRGSKPDERPSILEALAKVFQSSPWLRPPVNRRRDVKGRGATPPLAAPVRGDTVRRRG
jgi:hypothetical protein